jgi:HAD superfamily hydrolase (TIGR01509 family)
MNKAVIFDMDGVLVDSEVFWAVAEREIFEELGVILSEENTSKTKSMTTNQVIEFWHTLFPWKGVSFKEVEERVIDRVIHLVKRHDCIIPGVKAFIENLKINGYKIGLATNSPLRLIPVVLEKTGTAHLFDELSSAEFEQNGKPHPDIYLNTAKKLDTKPSNCIVIEDSYYGMQSAKAAGMKVWAFTAGNTHLKFDIADGYIHNFADGFGYAHPPE